MNLPVVDSQNNRGMKAASVVAVELIIGQNIRSPAILKASKRARPSSIFRSANSTMTMALSTKTPTERISPKRIIILMVSPAMRKPKKAIRKLAGIAHPTKIAERQPRAAIQTIKTKTTALMMEAESSAVISLILSERDWL